MEELAKEEKRRSQLRAQIQRENELAEQHHREESMRIDSYHIGNGYVELVSESESRKLKVKVFVCRSFVSFEV